MACEVAIRQASRLLDSASEHLIFAARFLVSVRLGLLVRVLLQTVSC